jgi:hypothetical protein
MISKIGCLFKCPEIDVGELRAEPTLRLSSDTRLFTLWPSRSAHPAPLRVSDLDRILSSGADFARKFDLTIDPIVMDELDRVVAG